MKEASASSEALGRVSKQISSMDSIAKAFPLTDPKVSLDTRSKVLRMPCCSNQLIWMTSCDHQLDRGGACTTLAAILQDVTSERLPAG